jgi:hypothetical protein
MSLGVYPISELESFRKEMASEGKYYKIRYRGPRNTVLDRGRSPMSRASTCLKANAIRFAVYKYSY